MLGSLERIPIILTQKEASDIHVAVNGKLFAAMDLLQKDFYQFKLENTNDQNSRTI